MRHVIPALLLAVATLAPSARADELDPATRGAVDAGLTWLAARWDPDAQDAGARAKSLQGMQVVTPALGGLAFLAAGASPTDDTPNGRALAHCLKITLAAQRADGFFADPSGGGSMYAHAFMTYFVAQALAKSKDGTLKPPLERAVKLIEQAQNPEGGWRYRPEPNDADSSATSCQLLALRAAQRVGVRVDPKVVDRAAAYLKPLQLEDGGFRYMPDPKAASGTPRSAATLVALHAWGKSDAKDHARALDYVAKSVAATRAELGPGQNCEHFYYRAFYLAHAFWPAGGEYRDRHLPLCQQDVLMAQTKKGTWEGDVNAEYATAMALIALQIPEGRLVQPDDAPPDGPARLP